MNFSSEYLLIKKLKSPNQVPMKLSKIKKYQIQSTKLLHKHYKKTLHKKLLISLKSTIPNSIKIDFHFFLFKRLLFIMKK
jgi:hypothetical protein